MVIFLRFAFLTLGEDKTWYNFSKSRCFKAFHGCPLLY